MTTTFLIYKVVMMIFFSGYLMFLSNKRLAKYKNIIRLPTFHFRYIFGYYIFDILIYIINSIDAVISIEYLTNSYVIWWSDGYPTICMYSIYGSLGAYVMCRIITLIPIDFMGNILRLFLILKLYLFIFIIFLFIWIYIFYLLIFLFPYSG